jgi:mono/diheme cytochrome c family protein
MKAAGALLLLLVVGPGRFSWAPGPGDAGLATRPRPAQTEALRAQGAKVYARRCAPCHGRKGDGKGWAARALAIPPRDFTAGVFKVRSTPMGSIPTDADLFGTISRGLHGTPMMAWRGLPEEERWALVEHLKTLSIRFAQERPEPVVVVPPEPPVDDALVARGAELWSRLHCNACHGAGDGKGPGVALLQKDPLRHVQVRDLARGELLRGTSARDIYLTLRTGMDGTPMGSYADALTPDETWALAAYVRTLLGAGR